MTEKKSKPDKRLLVLDEENVISEVGKLERAFAPGGGRFGEVKIEQDVISGVTGRPTRPDHVATKAYVDQVGSVGGYVFFTDIHPLGDSEIGTKHFQDGDRGTVFQSCVVGGNAPLWVRLHVQASYPLVRVGFGPRKFEEIILRKSDHGYFSGYFSFDAALLEYPSISAQVRGPGHYLGPRDVCFVRSGTSTRIENAQFTGGYPPGQTEVKSGDVLSIKVTASDEIAAVRVLNEDACVFAETNVVAEDQRKTVTIPVTVANRGNNTSLRGASLRVKGKNGIWSKIYKTTAGGRVDGVHVVRLNNTHPKIEILDIKYPDGQKALKGNEQAEIKIKVLDTNKFNARALVNSQSNIPFVNVLSGEQSPDAEQRGSIMVARIAGKTYFDQSNPNIIIEAWKESNNAKKQKGISVFIADEFARITMDEPRAPRYRTGAGEGAEHDIFFVSDQPLLSFTFSHSPNSPGRLRPATETSPGSLRYRAVLVLRDGVLAGEYEWGALTATNLAKRRTSEYRGPRKFEVGGFLPRSVVFQAFRQEAVIDISVTDYEKLRAAFFSATNQPAQKALIMGDRSDKPNTYTIDAEGKGETKIYWNDARAAKTNSTGTAALIGLEETP